MAGGHRPGTSFVAKCLTTGDGHASLSGAGVSVTIQNTDNYFVEGTKYLFAVIPLTGEYSLGKDSAEPQAGS